MGDVVHVDSAGSDVGGHQYLHMTTAEGPHDRVSCILGLVRMDRIRSDASLIEPFGDTISLVLGPCEDQSSFHVLGFNQMDEQGGFLSLINHEEPLVDGFNRGGFRCRFDHYRLIE